MRNAASSLGQPGSGMPGSMTSRATVLMRSKLVSRCGRRTRRRPRPRRRTIGVFGDGRVLRDSRSRHGRSPENLERKSRVKGLRIRRQPREQERRQRLPRPPSPPSPGRRCRRPPRKAPPRIARPGRNRCTARWCRAIAPCRRCARRRVAQQIEHRAHMGGGEGEAVHEIDRGEPGSEVAVASVVQRITPAIPPSIIRCVGRTRRSRCRSSRTGSSPRRRPRPRASRSCRCRSRGRANRAR